jgi:hypothetical protein
MHERVTRHRFSGNPSMPSPRHGPQARCAACSSGTTGASWPIATRIVCREMSAHGQSGRCAAADASMMGFARAQPILRASPRRSRSRLGRGMAPRCAVASSAHCRGSWWLLRVYPTLQRNLLDERYVHEVTASGAVCGFFAVGERADFERRDRYAHALRS